MAPTSRGIVKIGQVMLVRYVAQCHILKSVDDYCWCCDGGGGSECYYPHQGTEGPGEFRSHLLGERLLPLCLFSPSAWLVGTVGLAFLQLSSLAASCRGHL